MKQTAKYLADEHMQMYEWNGLRADTDVPGLERSKRTHAWHASYGVLAVLTTLLLLNGCDRQVTAEQASEQIGQAAQESQPAYDDTAPPADAAAPAADATSDPAGVTASPPAESTATPEAAPAQQP